MICAFGAYMKTHGCGYIEGENGKYTELYIKFLAKICKNGLFGRKKVLTKS